MDTVIQLMGPTAAGKSRISIQVAREFNCEIISADSMQVYRGFDLGTDKVPPDQRDGIPHHLIDILENCEQFNAHRFLIRSHRIAREIIGRGRLPLVSGGTALYFRVMDRGIFPEKKDRGQARREIEEGVRMRGLDYYWRELIRIDPEYAQTIGPRDRIRIVRALEIHRNTGLPPTRMFRQNQTPFADFRLIRIALKVNRDILYQRIEQRVEDMIRRGLVEEVRQLAEKYPRSCPPFRAIGYREILDLLDGKISLPAAVDLLKRNSRRYAKRQLTWFRNQPNLQWFSPDDIAGIFSALRAALGSGSAF